MTLNISGPGVGRPLPTNLYPTQVNSAPYDLGNAYVGLSPGDTPRQAAST